MKQVLLISDTHGYFDPKLEKYIKEADEVWHAGDIGSHEVTDHIGRQKALKAVYGNIDGNDIRSVFPEHQVLEDENVRVLMIHIAGAFAKYTPPVQRLIREVKPKMLVCGHSHILKIQFDQKNDLLYVNPGACGNHGFHSVRTAVRFALKDGEITNASVIELGKRSKQ